MGSIPNGSAPLQACARQIFMFMPLGRTGKAQVFPTYPVHSLNKGPSDSTVRDRFSQSDRHCAAGMGYPPHQAMQSSSGVRSLLTIIAQGFYFRAKFRPLAAKNPAGGLLGRNNFCYKWLIN